MMCLPGGATHCNNNSQYHTTQCLLSHQVAGSSHIYDDGMAGAADIIKKNLLT